MASISLKRSSSGWARFFPCLTWIPKINRQTLKADFVAGLTVALVAIPQSLAYAQLAGVPAYYGLYAALLPVIVGALFGSSPILSTGPVAMTSLLTAASVMSIAHPHTEQFYSGVILIALLSGIFQIGLGLARLGRIINFLSYPVLHGFINAAAIIIGLSQLPAMLGIAQGQKSGHFLVDIFHVVERWHDVHILSICFGITALALLLILKKTAPKFPAVLLVVSLATLVSWLIGFETSGGVVVGAIPRGLPGLSIPDIDYRAAAHLGPASFIIAIISFMEAMSSSKIIAIKTRTRWDENQELIGQGMAKIVAAFSHSMPVSGSFSRSALNLIAGAKTGLASVFSAGMVLIVLLFCTPLLYHLPKPVLSAVIMAAVFNLINFRQFMMAWVARKDDGVAAVVTFIATLMVAPNIQNGILTGIILSLIMFLYRTMKPEVIILGKDENGVLRDARRYNLPKLHPRLIAIRFSGHLYFANVSYINDSVLKIIGNDPNLQIILIECGGINSLDASGVEMFINLHERLQIAGITLAFCNLRDNVAEIIQRTGLDKIIGPENIFVSENQALEALNRRLNGENQ